MYTENRKAQRDKRIKNKVEKYRRKKKLDKAIIFLKNELDNNPIAHSELAQVYFTLNDFNNANIYLKGVIDLTDGLPFGKYYDDLLDDLENTYMKLQEKIGKKIKSNKDSADLHIFKGLSLLIAHHPDLAIDSFYSAIELNPENLIVYLDLGKIHYNMEEYQQANNVFTKGIDLLVQKPDLNEDLLLTDLYYNRSMSRWELSHSNEDYLKCAYEDAQKVYDDVNLVFGDNDDNHYIKNYLMISANYFFDNGECEKAIPLLERVRSTDPYNPAHVRSLALAYNLMGRYEEALELVDLILEDYEFSEFLHLKADILQNMDNMDEAVVYFRKFIASVRKNNIEDLMDEANKIEKQLDELS